MQYSLTKENIFLKIKFQAVFFVYLHFSLTLSTDLKTIILDLSAKDNAKIIKENMYAYILQCINFSLLAGLRLSRWSVFKKRNCLPNVQITNFPQ